MALKCSLLTLIAQCGSLTAVERLNNGLLVSLYENNDEIKMQIGFQQLLVGMRNFITHKIGRS